MWIVTALVLCSACGRKGPPLPPIVRTPAAPAELVAERRGAQVEIQFTVPGANTDGTRPANLSRIDVYAFTGPIDARPDEVVRQGTRIASVDVKAPRDPDNTIDPDEPSSDMEPLVGHGLDQGARTKVEEQLAAAAPESRGEAAAIARSYVGVPITTRGRSGPLSNLAAVPLAPAPAAPARPTVSYDQAGLTVEWTAEPPASAAPTAYHVFELPSGMRLTTTPVAEPRFVDARVEWGVERCYAVRAVATVDTLTMLSEASEPSCVTPKDTFPPATPSGLIAIAGEGVISLIWDPNGEKDFAGYRVLRGSSADGLQPVGDATRPEATFADKVPTGQQMFYAVQAIDSAGNASPPSAAVSETAR